MSTSREPISVRTTRLNNLILHHSNATSKTSRTVADALSREGLLDALCILYNECNKDNVKKREKNVQEFVTKYRPIIRETHLLRVSSEDFNIKGLIGKGYFGDVHLALEKQTGDVYAMKKIKKSTITTSQVKEERDIMARRQSEWITSLQYAFQDTDHLYLVMEYLPGGDLLSLMIRNGAFDEGLAKFYLAELTLAINALHGMGYVHRDIKPENILIDRFGHIKLADFGNAAALNKDGNVISMSPVGTPDYIAPELLQTISSFKNTKSIHDVTCDFWSMGIIGYELLCETTPFHDENVHETYSKILAFCEDGQPDYLTYPDGIEMSKSYKKFIDGLVTKPSRRLTYFQILRHPFFEGTNWDSLRQMVPPIIPNVNGEDDISNFEDVERLKTRRSTFLKKSTIGNIKSNDFSGEDLPFLGYGFVHEDFCSGGSSFEGGQQSDDQINRLNAKISELQKTLKERTDEIKIFQTKLLGLERHVTQSDSLNKILTDAKDEMNRMKEKLKEKTIELASARTEIKTLKSSLKIEEEMRLKNDASISEVLSSTYKKWEKAKMLSDQNYEKQIAEKKIEISNINQRLIACETELSTKSEECLHFQEKIANYKEMLKSFKEQSQADKNDFEKNKQQMAEIYELKIIELKSKLKLEKDSRARISDELRDVRYELDESISSTNSNRQAKLVTNKNIDDMKQRLTREIEENKNLRSQNADLEKRRVEIEKIYQHLSGELEKLKEERILSECRRSLEYGSELSSPYRTAHGSLTDLHAVEEQLRNDLLTAKENEDAQRNRAEQLEKAVSKLEGMITKLSEQPKSVGDMLEKQNEKLEDKLATAREQMIVERQSARTANLSLWKLEKQVEDLTHEKNMTQRRMNLTEEKLKKFQNEKSELESKLRQAQEMATEKNSRINELREEIQNLKGDLQREHKMWETAEHERMKEKSEIIEHISRIHKLEEIIEDGKEKLAQSMTRNDSLIVENKRITREINEEREKVSFLNDNLTDIQIKLKSSQDNYEMLKVACSITDSQLSEIEVMLETEVKHNKMNAEKLDDLWKKLRQKDDEIAKLKQSMNTEIAAKYSAEMKIKTLQQELDELRGNFQTIHEQMISQQNQLIEKTSTLFETQEKCELIQSDSMNLQAMNANYERETGILKEENSRILTDLFLTKEENTKLTTELKECREIIDEIRNENDQLLGSLSEQKNYYLQRDIKSEATLAQHKKLIDYLQLKVEDLTQKKKKTLADKIFGTCPCSKKENLAPNVETSIKYRTLEEELKREKARNSNLKEQLLKAKTDIRAANLHDSNIVRDDDHRETTRMIESSPPKKQNIDEVDTFIQKEKRASQKEMNLQRTSISSSSTSSSSHRRRSYQTHRFEMTLEMSTADTEYVICMVCNLEIRIGSPYWKCKECKCCIHRKCRSNVKTSCDGIQIDEQQQQKYQQKQKKLSITPSLGSSHDFQGILNQTDRNNDSLPVDLNRNYTGDIILRSDTARPSIKVNCAFEMAENIVLLGCDTGLYAYHLDTKELVHIDGINCVNYIAVTKSHFKAIFVGNNGESLYQCDLRHLKNRSNATSFLKPKLDLTNLDLPFANLTSNEKWQMVQISSMMETLDKAVAIASTTARIVIMRYDLKSQQFKLIRGLDTATGISSILFTRHTAIVSSDKYFEIDLNSYTAEEFLDVSDTTLSHTRSCNPMAAFQISPQEFLLCFYEFGIFVDEYGCRSRPYDINWDYTPTGFIYREPLLYISHFQILQIIRIHRSFTNEISQQKLRKFNVTTDDEDDDIDDPDHEPTLLRTFINLFLPTILSECGRYKIYAFDVERETNVQQIYIIDGIQAIKMNTSISLETLSSQGTCLTLGTITTGSEST